MKTPKLIILCGPSGSGKSTIVKFLLENISNLVLSVSATTRQKREGEIHGEHYFFINQEEFLLKQKNGNFLECEEVYPGRFYGTLKEHVDELIREGKNVIFDVDVIGALNIKNIYGKQAVSIFIKPPSLKTLKDRLTRRSTETPESLKTRLDKAETELSYAKAFDKSIINKELDIACMKALNMVQKFIAKKIK